MYTDTTFKTVFIPRLHADGVVFNLQNGLKVFRTYLRACIIRVAAVTDVAIFASIRKVRDYL